MPLTDGAAVLRLAPGAWALATWLNAVEQARAWHAFQAARDVWRWSRAYETSENVPY